MTPKYRIWHKGRKQMFMVSTIDFRQEKISYIDGSGFAGAFISFDDVILMQSTGLHDTNGVEIFEGDILKVCDDGGTHNEVVFRDGQALVMNVTYQDFDVSAVAWALDCYHGSDDDDNEYPIVIGNIHQNPELLEQ